MTVFEVTVTVKKEIEAEYRVWLDRHIHDVLMVNGFVSARFFEVESDLADSTVVCTQYALKDRASLDAYLRDHAPRLRAEGEALFSGKFTPSRRVMEFKKEYTA